MASEFQYLTDGDGEKTAVVLPLEDLEDLAFISERRDEPGVPHEDFVKQLRADGLLPVTTTSFRLEA